MDLIGEAKARRLAEEKKEKALKALEGSLASVRREIAERQAHEMALEILLALLRNPLKACRKDIPGNIDCDSVCAHVKARAEDVFGGVSRIAFDNSKEGALRVWWSEAVMHVCFLEKAMEVVATKANFHGVEDERGHKLRRGYIRETIIPPLNNAIRKAEQWLLESVDTAPESERTFLEETLCKARKDLAKVQNMSKL